MLRATTLLVLLIAFGLPAARAGAEDRGARRVDALLTLRYDPDSQAVLWPEVRALLMGSPRAGWRGAASAAFAEPPDTYRHIEVEREEAEEPGVLCVRIVLEKRGDDPVLRADLLLDALVARVHEHVRGRAASEAHAMRDRSDRLAAEIDARTKQIASGRAEGALPWPLSAAAFYENKLDRREGLRRELADLELDAATLEARREALSAQYEQLLQQEAAGAAEDADVEKEWATILRARSELVTELRAQLGAGKVSPLDLAMAEEELAQVRIQRAAARREAKAPSAARQQLEDALLGFEVDAAALEATRRHLRELEARVAAELEAGKANVLRVSRLEDEAQMLRERVLGLRERLAAWREPTADVIRLD